MRCTRFVSSCALVAGLTLAASCVEAPRDDATTSASSGGGGGGATCSDALCAPYTCDTRFDVCRTMCETTSQCTEGFTCDAGFCVGHECTEADAAEVCGPYACVKGLCAHDCVAAPCASGYHCRGDTNTCVPRCTTRADPVCEGYVCDLEVGECESYCADGLLPCTAGYRCVPGDVCEPDPLAPPCSGGCGSYACVEALDRCGTHCVVDEDCAAPALCDMGQCP